MNATTAIAPSDRFRRFHAEVQAQRRRVVGPPPPASGAPKPALVDLASAQGRLLDVLRALENEALGEPAADADAVHEEQALMAVFADDLFTGLAWEQAPAWRDASLEMRLRGVKEGRDGILRRIEELLRTGDPGRRATARLYLLALCLGLRGEGAEDDRAMADYRRRLLAFGVPGDAPLAGQPRELTPQACRHTSTAPGRRRIPALRPWALAALGSLMIAWAVSQAIWGEATRAVDSATSRILGSR